MHYLASETLIALIDAHKKDEFIYLWWVFGKLFNL